MRIDARYHRRRLEHMKKKKRARQNTKQGAKITKRDEAHSDREIADLILQQWNKLDRHITDETTKWYACVIGTLGAAKLIFRLDGGSNGALKFGGDPEALRQLEEIADNLADSLLADVKEAFAADGWLLKVPGLRLEAERDYLRLVRTPNNVFRWSKIDVDPNEPLPPEFDNDACNAARSHVDSVLYGIFERLGEARGSVGHDPKQALFERMSQWVALMGVAKFLLNALPDKLGAVLERFGELVSRHEYERITGQTPDDAGSEFEGKNDEHEPDDDGEDEAEFDLNVAAAEENGPAQMYMVGCTAFETKRDSPKKQTISRFTVLVKAPGPSTALKLTKDRLTKAWEAREDFLDCDAVKVDVDHAIELTEFPQEPTIIDFQSTEIETSQGWGSISKTLIDSPPGLSSYGFSRTEATEDEEGVDPTLVRFQRTNVSPLVTRGDSTREDPEE